MHYEVNHENEKGVSKKIDVQLSKWGPKIEILKAKANIAGAKARIKYYKQLEDLRTKQEIAKQKLYDLKGSGDEVWEELKAGVDNALEDLKEAFQRARFKFKEK